MCGIAGIIARQSPDLGGDLLSMLRELLHRGRDATGFAVYEMRNDVRIRVALTGPGFEKDLVEIISRYGGIRDSRIYQGGGVFTFYEAAVDVEPAKLFLLHWDIDTFRKHLDRIDFVPVQAIYFHGPLHQSHFRPFRDTTRICLVFLRNLLWKPNGVS